NWDSNSKIVHFGNYVPLSSNVHSQHKEDVKINCYPNPFSQNATIEVWQKTSGELNINLYNAMGQFVRTISHTNQGSGIYRFAFDAEKLPPGTYFCKATHGETSTHLKMIIY
ncbi:MAG: T9SS type A sorting domain-containing protein, partial [Ferruginibacter sp.]